MKHIYDSIKGIARKYALPVVLTVVGSLGGYQLGFNNGSEKGFDAGTDDAISRVERLVSLERKDALNRIDDLSLLKTGRDFDKNTIGEINEYILKYIGKKELTENMAKRLEKWN